MLKRLKQTISSIKGESYIYVCVLVLFISMLVSVVIMYMGLMAQVQIQKRDVEMKLDNCITKYAVEAFDSIKQGESVDRVIDLNKLKQNAYAGLGFSAMSRPTIQTLSGNGFGLTATYTVTFPISWGGKTFTELTVPITVTSYYKFK